MTSGWMVTDASGHPLTITMYRYKERAANAASANFSNAYITPVRVVSTGEPVKVMEENRDE